MRGIISEGPALSALGEPADAEAQAIELVLASLPDRTRAVADLRLRYQRSTREIAAEMKLTPQTIERHIRRATRALKAELPALLSSSAP